MAKQAQKQKQTTEQKKEVQQEVQQSEEAKRIRDNQAETDALLDEIEGVLEENAQDFVEQYVQKGGQ